MYRTRFDCTFFDVFVSMKEFNVETIIDSGCANTLLPLWAAKRCGGLALPLKRVINIAGNSREAQAYIIPKFEFGGYQATDVFVYAAAFEKELEYCWYTNTVTHKFHYKE